MDELHDVKEFPPHLVLPSPFYAEGGAALIRQLIKANQGALLIQAIGVGSLFANALGGS